MAKWLVKELSVLTGISVQTLHHYDRIKLLQPSTRLANGYRVYAEQDLLRLQQIIALKFFGFELTEIKSLLENKINIAEHFKAQSQILEQKANKLLKASKALQFAVAELDNNKSIPWENIIKLIEVYTMTQNLEYAWVKEIFTAEELKQYAGFEASLKTATPEAKAAFEEKWRVLVQDFQKNLNQDPSSAIGVELGGRCMRLINDLYGKKYCHLRTKIFEQGFAEGKGLAEVGLTPAMVTWLEPAIYAYWKDRMSKVFAQFGKKSSNELLKLWHEILDDMYGEETARKTEIYKLVMEDKDVANEVKQWLQSVAGL